MERFDDALDWFLNLKIDSEPRSFEEELVLPKEALQDLVAGADILTASGRGHFYIRETDYGDQDGVRVHYSGDEDFPTFAIRAKGLAERMTRKPPAFPQPNNILPETK